MSSYCHDIEFLVAEMKVLSSAEYISCNSNHVSINYQQIPIVGDWIMQQMINYSTETWSSHKLHPKTKDVNTLNWIFMVDLLNFSFWNTKDYTVTLDSDTWRGYWTLCALINRCTTEDRLLITDPQLWNTLTLEQLKEYFKTDDGTELPMLQERLNVLHEAGTVIQEKYQGSILNLIHGCNYSCQSLIQTLLEDFNDIWNDVGIFKGRLVYFLKRAQILVADIWAAFDGKGYGRFDDIDTITIFADYRIPQALVSLNILQYSPSAMDLIKNTIIPHNSPLEMEIRGNSIWAINLIQEYIATKTNPINAILIDFYIWDYVTKDRSAFERIPYHKTRSIYY